MTTITTKYPFVGCIDTKQGGRNENQDNAGFVDTPLGLLLVVCDGMGGGPGGRTASLMAVDTILNLLADVSEHTHREDALKFAIEKANDIIYSKAKETPELQGMGTTVAAILLNEDSAVIAHAGDTRIYQLRKGAIVYRSSDHSVVANLVRQKKMTEEEARNHPQSNIVTRALGIRPSMEIEFDEVVFLRGDRFVVCTDGIWGMMPQRDLVKSLSCVMGIGELTTYMTEEVDRIGLEKGGGHDNLTLAIVDTSFDSVLKKIKKNRLSKDFIAYCSVNDIKYSKKTRRVRVPILIAIAIVSAIILFVYLSQCGQDDDIIQERNQSQLKGSTVTTIDYSPVILTENDSDNQAPIDDGSKQVSPDSKNGTGNPFQDQTLREEQNKEIGRQINHIVKNLDSLKGIRDKNKGKTEIRKRNYVKDVIEPGINHLGNKVVDEKKKDIKVILKMLNDKKTISSDWRGRTTKDGIKHIDNIKIKVKGLQNGGG